MGKATIAVIATLVVIFAILPLFGAVVGLITSVGPVIMLAAGGAAAYGIGRWHQSQKQVGYTKHKRLGR